MSLSQELVLVDVTRLRLAGKDALYAANLSTDAHS